jgi:Tfp pilus assembly protein PilZ
MHRIVLRLDSPAEWIKVFDPRDGTVFVASIAPPAIGTDVRIDLTCGDEGPRVILRGTVMGHRSGANPGFISALGNAEREKVNYLNGFVRGGLLNLRAHRRIPVKLPVTYGGIKGPCETHTRDINDQGVFVLSDEPLPEDAEVHLLITVPGRPQPLSVVGIVSHTVVPEDEDVPGMGIVFRLSDAERKEVAGAVDALEKLFLAGELPEDTLA